VIQEVWYGTEVVTKIMFRHHNVAVGLSSLIAETDKNVTRQHGNGLNESLRVSDGECGTENAKYIPPGFVYGFLIFIFYSKEIFHSVVYS
jgi:hypothetical protein